jgi:hypothetical protein
MQVWFRFVYESRIQSRLVPAIGKTKDLLIEVSSVKPHRRSRSEKSAYAAYELISAIAIDIVGRTDLRRRLVDDEKRSRASSDKDQFTKEAF